MQSLGRAALVARTVRVQVPLQRTGTFRRLGMPPPKVLACRPTLPSYEQAAAPCANSHQINQTNICGACIRCRLCLCRAACREAPLEKCTPPAGHPHQHPPVSADCAHTLVFGQYQQFAKMGRLSRSSLSTRPMIDLHQAPYSAAGGAAVALELSSVPPHAVFRRHSALCSIWIGTESC